MIETLLSFLLLAETGPGFKHQAVDPNYPLMICTKEKNGTVNGRIQPDPKSLAIEEFRNGWGVVELLEERRDLSQLSWVLINPIGGNVAWVRKDYICPNPKRQFNNDDD